MYKIAIAIKQIKTKTQLSILNLSLTIVYPSIADKLTIPILLIPKITELSKTSEFKALIKK